MLHTADELGTAQLRSSMALQFGTPIINHTWPDSEALNSDLRALILRDEAANETADRTNIGGWNSEWTLLQRDEPCIARLKARIEQLVRQTSTMMAAKTPDEEIPRLNLHLVGWASILRRGNYRIVHSHPGYMWSGTYYVSTGVPTPDILYNGHIHFPDPRAGAQVIPIPGEKRYQYITYAPRAGAMLLFPSWLSHMVHPFQGEGERISISFNANFHGKPRT